MGRQVSSRLPRETITHSTSCRKYTSWTQAFQQIAHLAQTERLTVVIDEFTYLLAVEVGIASLLLNIWDHVLSKSNHFLVISGAGWTLEAQQFALSLAGQRLNGDNWRALEMQLLDLKQVDQDLSDWTV